MNNEMPIATGVASSSAMTETMTVPAINGQTYDRKSIASSAPGPKVSGMMAGRERMSRKAATKASTTRMVAPPVHDRPKKTLSPTADVVRAVFFVRGDVDVTLYSCNVLCTLGAIQADTSAVVHCGGIGHDD